MTAGPQTKDEPKHNGARKDANEREAGCVNASLFQRQPAEQRVARERDHREQRQDKQPCGWHLLRLEERRHRAVERVGHGAEELGFARLDDAVRSDRLSAGV